MARAASAQLAQLWRQRIDSQAGSGLSVVRFCKAHGLQAYNFYFWRRKLANFGQSERNLAGRNQTVGGKLRRNSTCENQFSRGKLAGDGSGGLVPLKIVGMPSNCVSIRFASGVVVEAPPELACRVIEQILLTEQALKESDSDLRRGAAC